MRKLPLNRIKVKELRMKPSSLHTLYLTLNTTKGFTPVVFLIIAGIVLAIVIFLIATSSGEEPIRPVPSSSPNQIVEGNISSPIEDYIEEDCEDEFNADCIDMEGDDVDPADLAGPD